MFHVKHTIRLSPPILYQLRLDWIIGQDVMGFEEVLDYRG